MAGQRKFSEMTKDFSAERKRRPSAMTDGGAGANGRELNDASGQN